jgi:RNA polymerase subunit RPABC4/transcription elongation factor Spt4
VALFTQLLYWQDKTRISGGWIAKSAKDWSGELYLSQGQVSRITKKLGSLKLIETKLKKFDGSPTAHYRLRETELKRAFVKYLKTGTSILTKGENPIGQKGEIDFDKRCKSLTEPTTKLTPEKKAESDFSSFEIIDFNDSEISKITSDVIPKEKSCGKKEKVTVQLPFESESFEQVWNGWKSSIGNILN